MVSFVTTMDLPVLQTDYLLYSLPTIFGCCRPRMTVPKTTASSSLPFYTTCRNLKYTWSACLHGTYVECTLVPPLGQ